MGVGLFLLIISVAALLQQRDKNSVVIIMKDLYTMYIEAYTDRFEADEEDGRIHRNHPDFQPPTCSLSPATFEWAQVHRSCHT
uniref:Uncharacterized protein n=1 Tax=Ciona intestinalis TaxID=7719 RepID=H2XKX2_CIOIN